MPKDLWYVKECLFSTSISFVTGGIPEELTPVGCDGIQSYLNLAEL